MGEVFRDRGHTKFGDPAARKIEEGLANGDIWQLTSGISRRGVNGGSARDGGRAIAARMYREGDGVPLSDGVFVDPAEDGQPAPDVGEQVSAGVFIDRGVVRDPGMTDEQHARRVEELSQYPSMAARIIEATGAEIPATVFSGQLN